MKWFFSQHTLCNINCSPLLHTAERRLLSLGKLVAFLGPVAQQNLRSRGLMLIAST